MRTCPDCGAQYEEGTAVHQCNIKDHERRWLIFSQILVALMDRLGTDRVHVTHEELYAIRGQLHIEDSAEGYIVTKEQT